MRIALTSYRGHPHSGGQGIYVRYLSRSLAELGHDVTVVSGPPYPELDDGVGLVALPSLDLYNPEHPFRRPPLRDFRDAVDVLEYAMMCTAAFPEPLTFTLRLARALKAMTFDVVHDNQSLGYGLLAVARHRPVVATIHHPCSIDRSIALAHAPDRKRSAGLRRWYSFTRMQGRVARMLPRLIAVSEAGRRDIESEFDVDPRKIAVVPNGVDTDLFRPLDGIDRSPGRILTTASADVPLKGLVHLIEAVAKLRTERDVELVVVGRTAPGGAAATAIERFGLREWVRFEPGIDRMRLIELYAQAEVAVVPSLYEGFSLPAVEAMSCGVPLVATTAGALPEVVGRDGDAACLVPPGDPSALAAAITRVLDDPVLAARMRAAGRARVLQRFTWRDAARATVDEYARVQTC